MRIVSDILTWQHVMLESFQCSFLIFCHESFLVFLHIATGRIGVLRPLSACLKLYLYLCYSTFIKKVLLFFKNKLYLWFWRRRLLWRVDFCVQFGSVEVGFILFYNKHIPLIPLVKPPDIASPSNSFPASSLRALSGLGYMRRHLMVMRMCLIPRSGFQSFFRVLTQISPVGPTLGWNILVRKKPKSVGLTQLRLRSRSDYLLVDSRDSLYLEPVLHRTVHHGREFLAGPQ